VSVGIAEGAFAGATVQVGNEGGRVGDNRRIGGDRSVERARVGVGPPARSREVCGAEGPERARRSRGVTRRAGAGVTWGGGERWLRRALAAALRRSRARQEADGKQRERGERRLSGYPGSTMCDARPPFPGPAAPPRFLYRARLLDEVSFWACYRVNGKGADRCGRLLDDCLICPRAGLAPRVCGFRPRVGGALVPGWLVRGPRPTLGGAPVLGDRERGQRGPGECRALSRSRADRAPRRGRRTLKRRSVFQRALCRWSPRRGFIGSPSRARSVRSAFAGSAVERGFTVDLAKTLIEAPILASPPVLLSAKRRLVHADRVGEFQEAPLREPTLDDRIASSGRIHVVSRNS
jgi:hypothetical protein